MARPDNRPLLIANADLPAGQRGGVFIEGGIIRDVGASVTASAVPDGCEVIDARGLNVIPGLIDLRAVIGEPGAEHRETLATASAAAAAGGVTTIVASPETNPVIDDPATLDYVQRRARDTAITRVHVMAALTKGLAGAEMSEIGMLKEAGAVAFTDGARSVMNAKVFRHVLTYARDFDALIVHHTEDATLATGVMNEGEFASRLGLPGTPAAAEAMLLERDIRLVRLTGARYHAAALTCRESLDVLARAKHDGLPVTASATINHLTLNENDVGQWRTFCKLSPPLRLEADRLALVDAVKTGLIDCIVSDHNPQDVETKRLPFAECADGAIGLETMFSAGMRLVHDGSMPFERFVEAMTAAPAMLLGLPQGRLARGAPADVVLVDPDAPFVLDKKTLRSRAKNSPFDEARLMGQAMVTIVAGRVVFRR